MVFSAPLVKAWFELSKDRMTEEDLKTVERASMIDLTNEHQMEILYEYYHMNFETIAFWVPGWSWLQKYKSFAGKLLNPSMFFFEVFETGTQDIFRRSLSLSPVVNGNWHQIKQIAPLQRSGIDASHLNAVKM